MLFTTQTISLREANVVLSEAGFRGVMRLDEVRQVESIPLMGTGKTDYKALRRMIELAYTVTRGNKMTRAFPVFGLSLFGMVLIPHLEPLTTEGAR